MREETTTRKLYKFYELSEEARKKAMEKLYDINVDYDEWADIDGFTELLEIIGIEDPKISYSGFSSQGDGLSFTGRYRYKVGALQKVKKEWTTWTAIHDDVKKLQDIQKKYFYYLSGKIVRNSSHYSHENTVSFDLDDRNITINNYDGVEKEVECILRSIMQELYISLEKSYDYLTSKEAIIETIQSNEYEFTESGIMA